MFQPKVKNVKQLLADSRIRTLVLVTALIGVAMIIDILQSTPIDTIDTPDTPATQPSITDTDTDNEEVQRRASSFEGSTFYNTEINEEGKVQLKGW